AGGFDSTFALAGDGAFTEPIRVRGIGADHVFNVARSGTWAGTLTPQYSLDGPQGSFIDFSGTTYTTNATSTLGAAATFDNVTFWVRVGFKPGGYTSGVVNVQLYINTPTAAGKPTLQQLSGIAGVAGLYRVTAYNSP